MSLKSWAQSDIGRKRTNNEDSLFCDNDLGLFMVADGMGGHKGGDKASKLAITVASNTYKKLYAEGLKPADALKKAVQTAAKEVYENSLLNPDLKGMGTTLSALVVSDQLIISHIGDSRIYRLRDRKLFQLTTDHSLVHEQVIAGIMTEEEARTSSLRNIITRAIGHDQNAQADHFSCSLEADDMFLLCTDGLNNMLKDDKIRDIITKQEPKKSIHTLISEANLRGGDDNISVILISLQR